MNRTLRAAAAVILVGVIVFCAVIICQNVGGTLRLDITDQKLYTLSKGTKAILGKLNQPLKLRLYYTKTAARKAPDQIRFYNNYYYFVEALLKEYARAARGMIKLEVIDPRPFSDEEEEAFRYGLRRFPITEEENFLFGLVLQTEFGVVKNIPFFSPDRQNFVEYDISHLIDTAVTREKKRIGVMSSLAVMEDVSGYMAYLRQMQGQPPRPPWTIVQHLRQQYDVSEVKTDVEEIEDVDILLVIHPTDLAEKTLFAIDQFVLKGGRAIICVDPHCLARGPTDQMGRQTGSAASSNLNRLLRTWGVEMLEDTFAGDRSLALLTNVEGSRRMEKLIGYLGLAGECFNTKNVVTANLNEVRLVFPGVLHKLTDSEGAEGEGQNEIIPLLQTTAAGNSWQVEGPWDWVRIVPEKFMRYFTDGSEPVIMACLIQGSFKSSFPDGIEVSEESSKEESSPEGEADSDDETSEKKTVAKRRTGLVEASGDCAVVVFADVDFIRDIFAYRDTGFGIKVPLGNNSDLLLNAIEDLRGSRDLIGLRSRGNFSRLFVVVEKIRREAEQETAEEIAKLSAKAARLDKELQQVAASAKEGQEGVIAASFVEKQRELEVEKHRTEREIWQVRKKRREKIEQLGTVLENLNMWSAPAVILVIAIVLGIRRSVLRRRYVSHASDA